MKFAVEVLKLVATVGAFAIAVPPLMLFKWTVIGVAWIAGARR